MRLTKNFTLRELRCKDGTEVPEEYLANAQAICERAQVLRDLLGTPLEVRSGYRSPEHNRRVGGATWSKHLKAEALDLHSKQWSAAQLAELYGGLIRLGLVEGGGLGVYPRGDGGWIHIDLGGGRRWRG